jgi:hypothetical protein
MSSAERLRSNLINGKSAPIQARLLSAAMVAGRTRMVSGTSCC